MDVFVVAAGTGSDHHHQRRRKGSSGHVVAQLLESPLPTPRRSCCGRSADTPAAARRGCGADDASPQRGHVPFKWESSPGVPKSAAAAGRGGKAEREVPLPKPPPGRCGTCHAARAGARAYRHHGNATDSSSSHRQQDEETSSDALDRISSSDRLAALSARLSAIDGGVFGSRRSPSFIMDRFLPAATAIATTSADKHPRRRPSPRCRSSKSREADAEAAARARFVTRIRRRALAFDFEQPPKHPPRCQREDAAAQLPPCGKEEEAQGEQMTPRACGFMLFVPWSVKPVLLGFSPARSRTPPRADVASVTTTAASSPPRRSVTLGHVLEKDRKLRLRDGGLSHWYDEEKSGSGKEWASPGWGMALLGTSKRYCADARKALSRLTTRSGMYSGDDGDSPRARIGRERSSSKHKKAASMLLRSTAVEMPPLSPPSESWLSNARRSNAGVTKVDGTCDRRESPFTHTTT